MVKTGEFSISGQLRQQLETLAPRPHLPLASLDTLGASEMLIIKKTTPIWKVTRG